MYDKNVLISVKKITKTYQMGEVKVDALKGVSLQICEGDFLIITGRNGSGKSTLLHQLGLLDRPARGEITIDKKNVLDMSEKQRSDMRLNSIGYIFQEYALIEELSAIENVMLPAMMIKESKIGWQAAKKILIKVGMGKKLHNLPKQLSGGEQQKVAIARSLINNPKIIFADEPTANLDSVAAHEVMEIFKNLNSEGHTIIMITHEQEETAYAKRLIKLSDGNIV